jgi:carbonic anhydrase
MATRQTKPVMRILKQLFENNRAWAEGIRQADPEFFAKLSRQQSPSYLWIGCSDSRVPANQIVGLVPGEMFVHRNIANVVSHSDLNCLSVLQFAVEVLKIKHIIVCGHYGCAGVRAVQRGERIGLADHWLCHVENVRQKHAAAFPLSTDEMHKTDRLCELNVIEQVVNVCHTTIAQEAWRRGQELAVHGWIYGVEDGLLRDLNVTISGLDQITPAYDAAISALASQGR